MLMGNPKLYIVLYSLFLADTLAAHALGGFKGSMSFSLRVCRMSMITPNQISSCFVESSHSLRTPESYFQQCSLLPGHLEGHYSTLYGINYYSVLENVPGFSVIHGLPHDMHDLYEGIVPYEMKLLLCHCLDNKYFSIDELNGRIDRLADNKPRHIDSNIRSEDSKRQSASQMLSFCMQFPMVIGHW